MHGIDDKLGGEAPYPVLAGNQLIIAAVIL